MSLFQDKTAVVTGAASGIGQALCMALAQKGAYVVAADIHAAGADQTAARIISQGGQAHGEALDVTKANDVAFLIEETFSRRKRLDFVFNNAGIAVTAGFCDTVLADWRAILGVNLLGVVNGMRAALPLMTRQGFGHIINTASAAGLAPMPFLAAYGASKSAVAGLSQTARIEAADKGVKVSVLCPGVVQTPIIDNMTCRGFDKQKLISQIMRMTSPEKCAATALKGVEKNRAVILAGPDALFVYHCHRFLPGLHERLMRLAAKRSRRVAGQEP